jgi:cytochrome c heme-lyase
MPATANQQPAPGQMVQLPTDREASSIPKGGTESTWLYPSPQMFWNALVRKNKTEGVQEEDMHSVIRIHNSMNERSWRQVLEWEKLRPQDGPGREPKLLRFLGRPDELSPKARLKVLFGHPSPFDRHDWFVDRGGKEVRYIIDYYHDEAGVQTDQTPSHLNDFSSIRSIQLDVRPALDSVDAIFDRAVVMPVRRLLGKTSFDPLSFLPKQETLSAEQRFAAQLKRTWMAIKENCEREKDFLLACRDDQQCTNASIALQHCTAKVICPQRARDFATAIAAQPSNGHGAEHAYATMVKCIELFEIDSKKVLATKK